MMPVPDDEVRTATFFNGVGVNEGVVTSGTSSSPGAGGRPNVGSGRVGIGGGEALKPGTSVNCGPTFEGDANFKDVHYKHLSTKGDGFVLRMDFISVAVSLALSEKDLSSANVFEVDLYACPE